MDVPGKSTPSGLTPLPLEELEDKRVTGTCGAGHVYLSVAFDKTTGFNGGAPCTGLLLQRIVFYEDIVSCPCSACPMLSPVVTNDCYELLGAVKINEAGTGPQKRSGSSDERATDSQGKNTCGSSITLGVMRLYCIERMDVKEVAKEILEWKEGPEIGCPTGTNRASKNAPKLWALKPDYTANAKVATEWDCCLNSEQPSVLTVTIKQYEPR